MSYLLKTKGLGYEVETYATDQTGATVITGKANNRIVVYEYYYSSETAGTMQLFSNSTAITNKWFVAATGGLAMMGQGIELGAGESLKITTTTDSNDGHSVKVVYKFEPIRS